VKTRKEIGKTNKNREIYKENKSTFKISRFVFIYFTIKKENLRYKERSGLVAGSWPEYN